MKAYDWAIRATTILWTLDGPRGTGSYHSQRPENNQRTAREHKDNHSHEMFINVTSLLSTSGC